MMAFYPAAPLDRTARNLTVFVWALAGLLAAAGLVAAALGGMGAGGLLVVIALLDGGLCVVYRRLQPAGYRVDDAGVTVERRSAGPYRVAGRATVVPGARLGLRTMGSGGLYGYLGRFRLAGGATGPAKAFVTDRSHVVVVDVEGARVALSPLDNDSLVAELGGHRA
jgi:hypothetical protein